MGAPTIAELLIVLSIFLLSVAIGLLIYGQIAKKAGFSRWWGLIMGVPFLNIIMIWVFAFIKWNIEGEVQQSDIAQEIPKDVNTTISKDAQYYKQPEMNMNKILSLMFLVGVYVFWGFIVATGSDTLNGNITILSYNFDKLTTFIMFLTLVTVFVPTHALGFLDKE